MTTDSLAAVTAAAAEYADADKARTAALAALRKAMLDADATVGQNGDRSVTRRAITEAAAPLATRLGFKYLLGHDVYGQVRGLLAEHERAHVRVTDSGAVLMYIDFDFNEDVSEAEDRRFRTAAARDAVQVLHAAGLSIAPDSKRWADADPATYLAGVEGNPMPDVVITVNRGKEQP